jgi:hypothetical protein
MIKGEFYPCLAMSLVASASMMPEPVAESHGYNILRETRVKVIAFNHTHVRRPSGLRGDRVTWLQYPLDLWAVCHLLGGKRISDHY